jgi:hypothetical protein
MRIYAQLGKVLNQLDEIGSLAPGKRAYGKEP